MTTDPAIVRRKPRADRREQILDVASGVFAAGGFRGTSLASVAEKVGVSQQGVLHHYRTKEALILAVLTRRDEDDEAHLHRLFDGREPTFAERCLAVCARNEGQRELVRLFTVTAAESLDAGHPAHEFYRARYRRNLESLRDAVVADQRRGLLRADLDPATVAAETLALFNGLQLAWLMHEGADMRSPLTAHLARLAPGTPETSSTTRRDP